MELWFKQNHLGLQKIIRGNLICFEKRSIHLFWERKNHKKSPYRLKYFKKCAKILKIQLAARGRGGSFAAKSAVAEWRKDGKILFDNSDRLRIA